MKKFLGLGLLLLALAWSDEAKPASTGIIWNNVAVCDPNFPLNCLAPGATGGLPTTTTAAAPVAPAAPTATTSQLAGCQFVAAGVTFANLQQGALSCDASGNLQVGGNVSSGGIDAGNPVKIGGVFNTTPPTLTNGQRGDAQLGSRGAINVTLTSLNGTVSPVYGTLSSDAVATGSAGMFTETFNYLFNGATFDRVRPGPYQLAQVPITAAAAGSTGAVVATLAANATKFTYLCSFDISATGGVATLGPITITNLNGNTFTYQLFSTATGAQLQKVFTPCLQSTAINTSIVITTTADATASAVNVNAAGFQGP